MHKTGGGVVRRGIASGKVISSLKRRGRGRNLLEFKQLPEEGRADF
jgi:hypothetical protein